MSTGWRKRGAGEQPEQRSNEHLEPVAQSRPFTKQQRDTLCTVYAIASASTTVNSLPNIAKIVNELLTEDLEVQSKETEQEPVACPECKRLEDDQTGIFKGLVEAVRERVNERK